MAWPDARGDKWIGRYRDANGRIRTAPGGPFPTREQATAAAQLEEERIGRGAWLDPDAPDRTLSDYFDHRWIVARRLEVNGRISYRAHFNGGIRERFGDVLLRRITTARVQQWVDDHVREGRVKPGTIVQGYYGTLHAVLAARRGPSAKNDGLIHADPCAGVVLPYVPEREVNIYTPDQVDLIVGALDPWWRLAVWLDSEIGARWSELLALRPCDLDLNHRDPSVLIHRAIVQPGRKETGNGTPFMIKPYPKGRKWRRVGITDETREMLRFHINGRNLADEDQLFSSPVFEYPYKAPAVLVPEVLRTDVWPHGYPIERMMFARHWKAACATAGLPALRRHDLRASFISWLCDDPDLTPLQIMEIVGHTDWETTRRYAKTLTGTQKAGVAAIQGVRARFRGRSDDSPGGWVATVATGTRG